ncbi:alpha-E domain-containing protein [Leekyejoonella antrihumi]|uniref:Alpha-E domain-containing protein n=1 Tax=Leekyejoonella antrihumi TaxID=1660198 RepID=A0A563DXH5_9MICO|nr:alpha-E domain-containing protein [Leekyejoonella antrihumi]TWP34927.1 alpha-E domain-containing protein [Leekyejoonella antrihumi]
MGGGEVFTRAAREALDARVCPIDLSEYRSSADAGVLAGPGCSGTGEGDAVPPGVGPEAAEQVTHLAPAVMRVAGAAYQLGDGQLTGTMGDLLQVAESAERAQVFVLADAITRGVIDASDAGSPVQWLTDMAPCLEPGQASRVVQVARIITDPANACLRGILVAGRVTVRGVHASVREARRVRAVLPDASWEQLLGYYLALADHCPTGVLRDLSKEIIAAYGGDQAPTDEVAARKHESLSWVELPGG